LNEVLVINPEALKSLSLLGAKAALEEREADFLKIRERVALFSPKNPYFLGDVADTLGKQYRFEEAVVLLREALESDPQYWQGYALLGTNLIRLGEEAEGRKNLEIGFENDPFNVMTSNLLEVYDTLDTYVTLQSAHFRVNMNDKDAKILWPYMEPLLEKSWDRLTQKYEFIPESPVLVQVFENRQDFAVRSVGLPDIGPLVGICFGKVITLISPDTLNANWQEIAWHEFAHVITLQMTKNKIPRWLSEGISVWEERQGQSYWGRSQGLDLVRAVNEAKLLPFASLNEGFSGAKTNADLSFAYFQSYLVVEYIASAYGFETLRSLIDQYGVVKEDETRFQIVFNLSLNEFDSHFKDWASDRAAEINVHVHREDQPDDGEGHGHGRRENSSAILAELYNNASLKQYMNSRIEANSRDFQAHLQLGIVLFKEEDFAAAKQSLQTAYELLPTYTGYPSPPLVLAQIYEQEGDIEAQMIQLEILLENQQHDYDSALTLAKSALNSQQNGKADYYLNRALEVDPYKEEVHTLRARYAEVIGDAAMEVTEREVLLTLDVDDPVEAQTDLAEAYLKNNQWSAARASVLMALEIAPSYLRAQRLLLRTLTDEEQ
jgi:Tfp pilus assembly protein PilF